MKYSTLAYIGRQVIRIDEEFKVHNETRWLGNVAIKPDEKPSDIIILERPEGFVGIPLTCSHAGAPLSQGVLTNHGTIICPRHGQEYNISGSNGIGFPVSKDGDVFFLSERHRAQSEDVQELKDRILSLEMELEAQRAANSALEQQVISGMESMDKMLSEIEYKNVEWKEKSERLELLNDLVTRITDSINEVMIITGPNGKIQRVNQQALDVFKCGQASFVGRSVDEFVSRTDLEKLHSEYGDKLTAGLPVLYQLCFVEAPFEWEVSLKKQETGGQEETLPQPYLMRGTRLYDRCGKEEGAILVVSDISRVKEREFQRRQKEIEKTLRLLEVTLGNIRHGIAVFDDHGQLLVSNDTFGKVTGCADDWLVSGTSYAKFLELEESRISLSTLSSFEREFTQLQKKRASWESYYLDGRVIFCESNTMPNGGIVVVARDVSEQRKEAEKIRRLSYAVEQSPVEVIITDTDGNIEYVNAKFTENTGYTKDYAIGRKTNMVRSGKTPNEYYDAMWEKLQSGQHWRGEVLNRRKDGSFMWQLLSVAPMYDPDGEVRNYLATKENIDDRKKAEEELAKHRDHLQDLVEERTRELKTARDEAQLANKAKTEFLSSMSHELRTPLNGILGFSQLLIMNRREPLSDNQGEYVQQILKAGQHLLDLISEILDLAKIEAGKLTVLRDRVDVSEVLEEAIFLVQTMADERKVMLNNMMSGDPLFVLGDATRIKQAYVNLLSNAIKYNREGGEVTITSEVRADGMVALAVTDTGYGIAEDKMENLFTPFNRLGVEGQNIEGSGIGLTITRKLMHMMNGDITVSSQEDVGSTFTILLPSGVGATFEANFKVTDPVCVAKDINDEAEAEETQRLLYAGQNVLYIEDNWSNQFLVERALTNMPGLELKCVSDPKIGVELAAKDKPHIILMDINMPGMNGFEALETLQKNEDTSDIPVVAISAKASNADIEKGLKAGFRAYLTKPINIPNLLETIEVILKNRVH